MSAACSLILGQCVLALLFAAAAGPLPEINLEMAANYSEAQDGLSVLVMHRGEILFERYHNGAEPGEPHPLASGTKSFCGVIAAAAVQDGLLSLDEKVCETITEWKDDPRKSQITIRQLLSLTSGLRAGSIGRPPAYAEAIEVRAIDPPGTTFRYGPVPFQVFGEVMRRKLAKKGEDPVSYLKRRVLDPIGVEVAVWRRGSDGNPLLPQGAMMTAREWATFGEFLRNRGEWNGKPLVDGEALAACMKGSAANPMYGLTFWLPTHADEPGAQTPSSRNNPIEDMTLSPDAPEIYMAAGAGDQRLYVIPELELVVVRQGNSQHFKDRDFLLRLLKGETE